MIQRALLLLYSAYIGVHFGVWMGAGFPVVGR